MASVPWTTIQSALQTWVATGVNLTGSSVIWAQQTGPRPTDPWVSIYVTDIQRTGLDDWRLPATDNIITFSPTVSTVNTGTSSLTIANHGLSTGDGQAQVTSTVTIPGGLSASTNYWVIVLDTNTIQLASSLLNAVSTPPVPIAITTTGSGTIQLVSQPTAVRVGQEVTRTIVGVRDVTLSVQAYSRSGTGVNSAVMILNDLIASRFLAAQQDALQVAGIGVYGFSAIHNVGKVVSNTVWESRAHLDVSFYVTSQITEITNYIQEADITGIKGLLAVRRP